MSDLAYWVGRSDPDAALRMAEGFGAELSSSAAMRAEDSGAPAVALALAEAAERIRQEGDVRHAGWVLLSVKIEIMHLAAAGRDTGPLAKTAAELSGEIEEIASLRVRRGTEALASPT